MEALFIILIIVVLVFISRTNRLAEKVAGLEQRLDQIAPAAAPPLSAPAHGPAIRQPAAGHAVPVAPLSPQAAPSMPAHGPIPAPPAAARAPIPATNIPQPPAAPAVVSRTREEWELLVGGKLLNRIGAFALVIGVGFFLKYAFDNNWITETMRVVIGLLVGAGLLVGGERAKNKRLEIFAQGLVGAGLAILYLSVYASYNFYQLVAQPVALGAMSLVTIVAFIQALRYNALAISLLGWAGGFLTPFLLATDQPSAVGLFSYILLLDIGLLAVVFRRDSWVLLEFLTRGATYVVYALWYLNAYTSAQFGVAVLFISLFWGIFYLLHVAQVLRKGTDLIELRHLAAVVNTIMFYVVLYSLVNPLYPGWIGGVTLALGAVYFGTALLFMWRQPDQTYVHGQYTLTAIAALVLATALQLAAFPTVIGWALEALALVWCGQRFKLDYVRYSALGIFVLALLQLTSTPGAAAYIPIDTFTPLLNQRALAFAVLSLTLAASTLLFHDRTRQSEKDIPAILHVGWSVVLLGLLTVETNDVFRYLLYTATGDWAAFLRYLRPLTIGVLWIAYSLPLVWAGVKSTARSLMYVGVGAALVAVAIVALFGFFFAPIEQFRIVLNVRVAAFALLIGGLWLHARWIGYRPQLHLPALWYALVALLIFKLITVETRDVFGRAITLAVAENAWTTLNRLQNLQQLAISGVWLIYASTLIGLGFWRRVPALRIGAILLAGITILKIFVYDLAFLETLYRIFSFIGLGLILLGVSYLYQRYKAVIFGQSLQHTPV
ncbi:MAG TPA: DUF2339 domain-containing protein [Herpetosiphonaceae bacterium]